jgi:hypothetical protein
MADLVEHLGIARASIYAMETAAAPAFESADGTARPVPRTTC